MNSGAATSSSRSSGNYILEKKIRERDGHPETETAPNVDVTPEMIEAGYRVLCNSGIADVYLKVDKILVVEIFDAMFALLPREGAHTEQ